MCKLSIGAGSKFSLFVKFQRQEPPLCQVLNLRGISSIRQIRTIEPLVSQPRPDGAEIANETMECRVGLVAKLL